MKWRASILELAGDLVRLSAIQAINNALASNRQAHPSYFKAVLDAIEPSIGMPRSMGAASSMVRAKIIEAAVGVRLAARLAQELYAATAGTTDVHASGVINKDPNSDTSLMQVDMEIEPMHLHVVAND